MRLSALFRLAFAPAPPRGLTSPHTVTRRLILQKARHHGSTRRWNDALTVCKPTVSGTISLPSRGTFHLSLTVLVRYRSPGVLSLTRWSSQIHAGLPGSGVTWEIRTESECFSRTGLLPTLARCSKPLPLSIRLVTLWKVWCPRISVPRPRSGNATRLFHQIGLGYSRFARRY